MYLNILLVLIITGISIGTTVAQSVVPPTKLLDSWGNPHHNENLDLVHRDEHLAIYFESEMSRSATTWLFSPLSKAWKYAKETYGEFGPDPHLYVVLHANKHAGCREGAFITDYFKPRNLIDCGSNSTRHGWGNNYSASYFEVLLKSLAGIVILGAKGRNHYEDLEKTRGKSNDIIVYDLYRHVRGDHDPDLLRWKRRILNDAEDNIYYFRDWFLPLYDRFGGGSIMNKYYTIDGGPWKSLSYMNWGEYIHCCCEATGTDVKAWAMEAFKHKTDSYTDFEEELADARKNYKFKYSVSIPSRNLPAKDPPGKWEKQQLDGTDGRHINLTLVYKDEHVAVYSPTLELYPLASLKSISETWKYTKEKYGPFGSDSDSDQLLYIALQNGSNGTLDSCTSSNGDSFIDRVFNKSQVIDCFTTTTTTTTTKRRGSTAGLSASHFGPLLEEQITVQMASMPLKLGKSTGNWPGRNVSQWTMTSILVYDIYLGLGRIRNASEWRAKQMNMTETHYQKVRISGKETSWFSDWYLNIYENNGNDSKILQNFFSLLNTHWSIRHTSQGQNYAAQLNMGEFVHFWSGATGSSLKTTAMRVLNVNKDTFAGEWNRARESFPRIKTLYVGALTKLLPSRGPPAKWHKEWEGMEVDLSRAYSDGHVAYYTDGFKLNTSLPSLKSISAIWNYTKAKYGPFGPTDQLLYIALQNGSTDSCTSPNNDSFIDSHSGDRHVIDCSTNRGGSGGGGSNSFGSLLEQAITLQIASMPLKLSKRTGNWPGRNVSHWTMTSILAYDIYLGVGKNASAEEWRAQKLSETENVSANGTFWFRDWYLKIYENRNDGNDSSAPQNFFSLLNTYWPKVRNASHGRNYAKQLNMGEFVHFWSGATGSSLKYTAINALKVNERTYLIELDQARKTFPDIARLYKGTLTENLPSHNPPLKWDKQWNDMEVDLSRAYSDGHVAYYTDGFKLNTSLPSLKSISAIWNYTKAKYGPFGPTDQLLYIALQNGSTDSCTSPNNDSFIDSHSGDRHVIDCSTSRGSNGGGSGNSFGPLIEQAITLQIASMPLKLSKRTGNWPGRNVSHWTMTSILAYDIYLGVGKNDSAEEWRAQKLNETENFPEEITFWFRDWYLEIYENDENSTHLQNFFSLLNMYWPTVAVRNTSHGQNYAKQLNMGEFVHFWSGAAGLNLRVNATNSLHLNESIFEDEIVQARLAYPGVTELYAVEKALETFPDIFYIPLPIPSSGSPNQSTPQIPTKLTNVYKNESVGIYYDVDLIPKQVEWPSRVFTNLWKYTKDTYSGILDRIDPNLHVTFYKTGKEGCKHRDAPLEITTNKGGQKSFNNVIDCGVSTESGGSSWDEEDKGNLDPILKAISDVIRAEMNFQKNQDLASKTLEQVWKLVVFDLYMREGRLEDAFKWLKDSKDADDKIVSIRPESWFLDWCLPIYNNYGGARALSQFITILSREIGISHVHSTAAAERREIRKDIKLGEFIHLWSGAAGECLTTMAKKVLPSYHDTDREFVEAKEKFSNVTYECWDSVDEKDKIKIAEASREMLYVLIIGGVSLFAIVLISTAFGIKLYKAKLRERDLRDKIRNLTNEEVEEFIRGDNNYVESGNGNSNTPIHLMPFNTDFEVPKERLIVDQTKRLGEGAFGQVFEGKLLSKLGNKDEDIQVAVKTVKPNVEVPFFKAMLMEIKIMAYLGKHENIASLLATVTANIRNREVYVALEFCSKGDVLQYLKKNRTNFKDLWNQTPTSPDACLFTKGANSEKEPLVQLASSSYTVLRTESDTTPKISTLDLLELARQVASGMAYLSLKHVIHGDLAARNVLLTADNVAKVSDFGLSRQLENYKNYTKKSTTPLPWRWMAIESLQEMIFSSETDIWAFGVTLWEIFTLGKLPFPGRTWDHEFVDFLIAGNRLQSPDFGNTEIYDLMMKCCRLMPDERLPFSDISAQLGSIKASLASVAHLHGGAYRFSSF